MSHDEGTSNKASYHTYLFNLFNYLLSSDFISTTVGIEMLVIKFLQMLSCVFNPIFEGTWKDSDAFKVLLDVLDAFRLVSFSKDNGIVYLIVFYLALAYLIVFFSVMIYSAYAITRNSFVFFWPLPMLKSMTYLTVGPFFIPLLSIYLSVFNCPESFNFYSKGSQCFAGVFILHTVLGIIAALALVYTVFIHTLYCFDIKYNTLSFNAKLSSFGDILFLLEQILFVLIREVLKKDDIAIVLYFLISIGLCGLFVLRNPYYNYFAKKFNLLLHLLVFWSVVSLALGRLLNDDRFSPLSLLIFGYVIIIPLAFIYTPDLYYMLKNRDKSGEDYLKKVMLYIDLVERFRVDREKEIILDTYLAYVESECTTSECPINKYLIGIRAGQINEVFLLQYAENIFIEGIKRNPYFITLRIYYALFLYEKLHKRHKARMQVFIAEAICSNASYSNLYLIHKTQQKLNPYITEMGFDDLSNKFAFITHKNELLSRIQKASTLYVYFWSSLYASSLQNNDNIGQLNKMGSTITDLISSITMHFTKLQEINPNDYVTLKAYRDFLVEILNDSDKANKYQKTIEILNKESEAIDKNSIIHIDLTALAKTDKVQYIILSMNQEKYSSMIQGMSLGICEALGYNKRELVGQSLDVIIPEMFKKTHKALLLNGIEEFKKHSIETHVFSKQFKTFPSFCLNKMRYLVPVSLSPGIIPNEMDEYFYITKIAIDDNVYTRNDICYVLTGMNKVIYSFSSNAVSLLNLTSNDMNSCDLEINDFITEVSSDNGGLKVKGSQTLKESLEQLREISWERVNKVKRGSRIFANVNANDKDTVINPGPRRFTIEGKAVTINQEKVGIVFKLTSKKVKKSNAQSSFINSQSSISNTIFTKDFVPSNKDQLFFHYNKSAYTITIQEHNEVLNQLKNDAMKEYNNSTVSSSSEYSSSGSYEDSNDKSGMTDSHSYASSDTPKPFLVSHKKSILPHHESEDYFKADFSIIKLSVYNYHLKTFELHPEEAQSQVEVKMKEILRKYETEKKEDQSSDDATLQLKDKEDKLNKNLVLANKEKLRTLNLKKQLIFALSKYETYPEITFLKLITFFVMIFVITEAIVFLLVYNELLSTIKENVNLISESYSFLLNIIVCIYLVREISLISNDNYKVSYMSMEEYRKNIQKDLLEFFFKCENILDGIMNSPIQLTDANYQSLYNLTVKVYMIRDDLDAHSFNITLFGLLNVELDSIHNIAYSERSELFAYQNRVYGFVVNGLNSINEGIKHQSSIFIDEMTITIDTVKTDSWILFAACFVISIPCYFLINNFYMKVADKKNAYLDIFYEIDRDIIMSLLHRCEKFTLKLASALHSNEELSAAGSYYDDYDYDNEESSALATKPTHLTRTHRTAARMKMSCSKEQIFVLSFLFIVLGLIIIVVIAIISLIHSVLAASYHSIEVFHQDNILQARYLTIFNIFREYMFDKSIDVLYHPLASYIEEVFSSIYKLQSNEKAIHNQYDRYIPSEYLLLRNRLNNINLCSYQLDFINKSQIKDFNCTEVTYGAGDLGLAIFLSWYLEEIKGIKNLFIGNDNEIEKYQFTYNLTLYNLSIYNEVIPTDPDLKLIYQMLHPLNFLNDHTHDQLVILFRYILLPVFLFKNESMIKGIMNYLNSFELTYRVMLFTVCGINLLVYLFIWKRVENSLNEIIYKSKNMLTIIPIEVLVNLSSVHKLFKLNTKVTNDSL